MTLIIARRFDHRIVVLSDTMITNRDRGSNALPGRLKSIVISTRLTVSYAGNSELALNAIRKIARSSAISAEEALEILRQSSSRHYPELDFILCAHDESGTSRLVRISDGNAQEGGDFYWIGSAESASVVSRIAPPPLALDNLPDYLSHEELAMVVTFQSYLTSGGDKLVGGVMVSCICSDYGHCYQFAAGASSWGPIQFPSTPEAEAERMRVRATGMNDYVWNVCTPAERGIGVVGVFLEQPGVGWIHEPLRQDAPIPIKAESVSSFSEALETHIGSRGRPLVSE